MAWREGEQVGPYQIISQVGQGGMATVYKAYHAQLDRTVAIKVMHQMFLDDEAFVARFKREAQIVARLDHPNIIPIYDYNEHEKQPYLVMRYVPGITVKQRLLKKGPLPLNEILSIMTAVGGALAYAHTKGVLHRDVKPSNIVLDNDVPYLTDFGLARIAEAGESTMSADMVLGTPHYISPEQANGRREIDGRADIYSLGIVLYELLVGRVPFTADTAYAIIHDQIYTPLPRPSHINPEIPQAVEEVLIRATEKRPEDRYATADVMMDELKAAIEESHLTELSPDRASVASESLARYRSELGGGFSTPPSTTIAQPIPSGSYRTATVFQSKPNPRQGRAWMISGCGTFIFISLIIASLMLSSLSYIQELSLITASISDDAKNQAGFQFMISRNDGLLTSQMGDSDLTSFLTLSDNMDTVKFLASPDPSFISLTSALSTWETDPTASYTQIAEGKAISTDPVRYLMLAAITAEEMKDHEAAVIYALLALHEADLLEDRALYDSLRPIVGQYLYNTPAEHSLNETDLFATIAGGMYYSEQVSAIQDTAYAHFVRGRILALADKPVLALAAVNARLDITNFEAEVRLLRGEILAAQDKMEEALTLWRGVVLDDSAPEWVKTQAQIDLTENEDS